MDRARIIMVLTLILAGCSEKLSTGYKPRPLSDSAAVRRSYYASPYTPESKPPGQEKADDITSRRPRSAY